MIRTESEYQECLKRLEQDQGFIDKQRKSLVKEGLSKRAIERALEPSLSFHEQLLEEVQWYEKVKRREFGVINNLTGLGQSLIALRIANGITQAELARRLDVSESQVSRDERNEYHGITVERAQRILNALDEQLETHIVDKPMFCEEDLAARA